jgi:hypothetical protein
LENQDLVQNCQDLDLLRGPADMGEQELNECMDFDHNLQISSALMPEELPSLSPTIMPKRKSVRRMINVIKSQFKDSKIINLS